MTNLTGTPGGFIRRAQMAVRPTYTLWHLSMPQGNFNPREYVEPVMRFNRTARPVLSRWRADYEKEADWSTAMFGTFNDGPSPTLIPHILAALQRMSLETSFDWLHSHTNRDVLFTTQEHMYPTRRFQPDESLSIT